jgi:TetR/AcrR family transcriptional regulator
MTRTSLLAPSGPAGLADDNTRGRLVAAAVAAFTSTGFDGTAVRDIERQAGVNRGLVAYHFGSKEALWKAAVVWLMARFHEEFERYREVLAEVSPPERVRLLYRVYARFSARYPEYFRLLMLECNQPTDRTAWLVDEHLRPALEFFNRVTGRRPLAQATAGDAIAHFLFIGAAATISVMPALSQAMYGVDPGDPAIVEAQVEAVARLGMLAAGLAVTGSDVE